MRYPTFMALSLLAFAATIFAAQAHSLDDVEQELWDREKYFQPIDEAAPAFALEDAEGRAFSLEDFRDDVVVLHFVYASCTDVCPLHTDLIARIQEMVNRTPMREQVRFVTVTTDPERDTPEVLREYAARHDLDPTNWVFLTSGSGQPEDATRQLAERFGHTFTKGDDGYQVHGVVTHVIDREGRWRANFHGLEFESTNLVLYVNALVHPHRDEPHRESSWWDKLRDLF